MKTPRSQQAYRSKIFTARKILPTTNEISVFNHCRLKNQAQHSCVASSVEELFQPGCQDISGKNLLTKEQRSGKIRSLTDADPTNPFVGRAFIAAITPRQTPSSGRRLHPRGKKRGFSSAEPLRKSLQTATISCFSPWRCVVLTTES